MTEIENIGALEVLFSPESIEQSLKRCQLPSTLLYDEKGLRLFDEITNLKEYYLYESELDILKKFSDSIANQLLSPDLPNTVIELGCGNMRKTKLLLDAFEKKGCDVHFYALDLNEAELQKGLQELRQTTNYQHVKVSGICGCFERLLQCLDRFRSEPNSRISMLYLGASIGNFDRKSAASFLRSFASRLNIHDNLLISFDHRNKAELVQLAYDDPYRITEKFEKNILASVNAVFGENLFDENDWEYKSVYDEDLGVHRAYLQAKNEVTVIKGPMFFQFKPSHLILIEESWKNSDQECRQIIEKGDFNLVSKYESTIADYSTYVITKQFPAMLQLPLQPCPSLAEWDALRKVWLFITNKLLNKDNMYTAWIPLRHPPIFYIGHVPVFNDIYLTKIVKNKATANKKHFWEWFQRGIDPDIEDPSKCHWHSEVPESWPSPDQLREYEKESWEYHIVKLCKAMDELSTSEKRILWLCYEHVAMHVETTLYIYVQSFQNANQTVSICGSLPEPAEKLTKAPLWVNVPETEIAVGMPLTTQYTSVGSNLQSSDLSAHENTDELFYFAWDNEKPMRKKLVSSFSIANRPISNGEYLDFINKKSKTERVYPKQWAEIDGTLYIRTMYGLLPLDDYLGWPVMTSYDDLNNYASSQGCRLPTEDELNCFYDRVLERTDEPYVSTEGKATGFQQLHPLALSDNSSNQIFTGAWEWTSTVLEKHEDFEPEELYPDYTRDFFDGKHNVVLGGSFATATRISNRRSFRNFYQAGYKYAWIGARLVKN